MIASAEAPGKIILFGEHAVVYGQPALAVPLSELRARASVRPAADGLQRFVSPEAGLDISLGACDPAFWGLAAAEGVRTSTGLEALPPFVLEIDSSIPVASGLGSGAAVAVAAIRALFRFTGREPGDADVNAIAFEIEKLHHGTPSGIDNTVVTFEKPVFFIRGKPLETFEVPEAFTIVVADTGITSPTAETVGDVRRSRLRDRERYEGVFERIGAIAREARAAIEGGNLGALGPLMDRNHEWLCAINVSSGEIETLVRSARRAGALGAKLSGGGRGGNIIALAAENNAQAVRQALTGAGAARTYTTRIGSQHA